MLLEGVQLGRYRLLHLLGSGGMGEVYVGEDTHIRRQVAIKVIRAEAIPYPNSETAKESARLFQREVRAIAMLDHPHILPLFDYGEENIKGTTLTYMVMPYRAEGRYQHGYSSAAARNSSRRKKLGILYARRLPPFPMRTVKKSFTRTSNPPTSSFATMKK